MALIQDYFSKTKELTAKYGSRSLVLMQVGSFFEVYAHRHLHTGEIYGSCLEEFVRICDFNEPSKKSYSNQPKDTETLMSGFPEYMIEKYVSRMQDNGYTCAVYTQDSNTKNTTRSLDLICSPGTHFSSDAPTLSNNIMCIWMHHRPKSRFHTKQSIIFGMSVVNVVNGMSNYNEIQETFSLDPTCFDDIERYYSIYQPNEILFVYDSQVMHHTFMKTITQFLQITCKKIHFVDICSESTDFLSKQARRMQETTYQREILAQIYPTYQTSVVTQTCGFDKHFIGCQSFCYLLDFIYSHNPTLLEHIQLPVMESSKHNVLLANHMLVQLNILDNNQHTGKLNSVVSFLTNAYTPMGKREMKYQLVHPTTNTEWLQNEYDTTRYIVEHNETFTWLPKHLKQIHDIPYYYRKLQMKQCKPTTIASIYHTMSEVKCICDTMKDDETCMDYLQMSAITPQVEKILHHITSHVSIEVCKKYGSFHDMFETPFVSGLYSSIDIMQRTYNESMDKIKAIQSFFSTIVQTTANSKRKIVDPCKIHHTDKSGLYLKMSATRSKLVKTYIEENYATTPKQKLSYVSSYDGSKKTFTFNTQVSFVTATGTDKRITNDEIQTLTMQNLSYKMKLNEAIKNQFKEFITSLQEYHREFYHIGDVIGRLDVIYGKARMAIKYNYCVPVIDDGENDAFVDAKDMRHVLIEHLNNDELYVPNDISLGGPSNDDTSPTQEGILLFGTNAVGKSSLIKSLGICVIMAQSGFFVPCSSFRYKPFKQVFTRILGNDNIFKGLSTFAVEMCELSTILRHSTKDSLILGDELCSGTELGSAISIFCAGLIQMSAIHSKFVFATHFHEITKMKRIQSIDTLFLKHMKVAYDAKDDCLVYDRKLCDGPGQNNYGLEVCKSLHLPLDFITLANEIRIEQNPETAPISLSKKSSYNATKLKTNCEKCGNACDEVHHLQHQQYANDAGFIGHFHKNKKANLMNVCEDCHLSMHHSNKQHRRVKTTKGNKIIEI